MGTGAVNLASFDLNLLRVLDALIRERSVTRAGERIGLSQPAVSAALARLRHALDDQLLVRQGNEMVPTARALEIAGPVGEALAGIESTLGAAIGFDPARAERCFTLLGADFFSTLLMPGLAEQIAATAPGVTLRFLDSSRGDVDRLLAEGVIDLALERPLELPEWIGRDLLFTSPFVVIAARGHPAVAAAGIRPGEVLPLDLFCDLPHALRSIDGSMSGMVDEAMAATGRRRRVVLALPHFFAIGRAVARGRVIAAVPMQFARATAEDLGLAAYGLPIPVPAPEVRLYWHRRREGDPGHAWLRRLVIAAAASL
jgi:DNA-binding transcriptional LysR family regulator